jgi:hypothetical protein
LPVYLKITVIDTLQRERASWLGRTSNNAV